jgi:hypothetical protein
MAEAVGEEATLEFTPTWIVAAVCSLIVLISLLAERCLHYLGKVINPPSINRPDRAHSLSAPAVPFLIVAARACRRSRGRTRSRSTRPSSRSRKVRTRTHPLPPLRTTVGDLTFRFLSPNGRSESRTPRFPVSRSARLNCGLSSIRAKKRTTYL